MWQSRRYLHSEVIQNYLLILSIRYGIRFCSFRLPLNLEIRIFLLLKQYYHPKGFYTNFQLVTRYCLLPNSSKISTNVSHVRISSIFRQKHFQSPLEPDYLRKREQVSRILRKIQTSLQYFLIANKIILQKAINAFHLSSSTPRCCKKCHGLGNDLNFTSLFPIKNCNWGEGRDLLCIMQPGHSYAQEGKKLLLVSIFQNHRKQPIHSVSIYQGPNPTTLS